MAEVTFEIESAAQGWDLTVPDASEAPLVLKPGTTETEELAPGVYDFIFNVRGVVGDAGTLTIKRPHFKDKVIKAEVSDGGIATKVGTFRVKN